MAKKLDLTEYLIQKLGGKTAVMQEFYGERLNELIASGATFGDIIVTSKKEKWYSVLATMSIADAMNLKTTKKGSKTTSKRSSRLTSADKEKMIKGILAYLKKNPWSGKKAIANSVGFEPQKVGVQIGILRKEKKIKSSGARSKMVYALKGEKKKVATS